MTTGRVHARRHFQLIGRSSHSFSVALFAVKATVKCPSSDFGAASEQNLWKRVGAPPERPCWSKWHGPRQTDIRPQVTFGIVARFGDTTRSGSWGRVKLVRGFRWREPGWDKRLNLTMSKSCDHREAVYMSKPIFLSGCDRVSAGREEHRKARVFERERCRESTHTRNVCIISVHGLVTPSNLSLLGVRPSGDRRQ